MADQVKITLGADVSGAIDSLRRFGQETEKSMALLSDSVSKATRSLDEFAPGKLSNQFASLSSSISSVVLAGANIQAFARTVATAVSRITAPMAAAGAAAVTLYQAIMATVDIHKADAATQSLAESNLAMFASIEKVIDARERELSITKKMAAEYRDLLKGGRDLAATGTDPAYVSRYVADLAKAVRTASAFVTSQGIINAQRGLGVAKGNALGDIDRARIDTQLAINDVEYQAGIRQLEGFLARKRQLAIESNRNELASIARQEQEARLRVLTGDEESKLKAVAEVEGLNARKVASEYKLQRDLTEIENTGRLERKRASEAILAKRDADEQRRIQKLQEEEEAISRIYEIERARIAGNFRLTDAQKRQATIDSLRVEGATLTNGGQSKRSRQQLGFLESDADPNSFRDQTIKAIVDIKNAMGTAAQNIAQVFTSPLRGAFEGLQTGIAGLIKGTMTWKDATIQLGQSILNSVVQALSQMIAKAAILGVIGMIPGVGSLGSIFGGIGARASGGIAGPGLYQVGERGPEYVVNNQTLNRMGGGFFDSLQAGYTPPQAAGGGGSSNVHIGFIGGPAMVGQWLETREGRAYVANIADQQIREARG